MGSLVVLLAALGLTTIPFISSLRLVEGAHRPVAVLFLLPLGGVALWWLLAIRRRVDLIDLVILLFLLYGATHSMLMVGLFEEEMGRSLRQIIVLTAGTISYFGLKLAFARLGFARAIRYLAIGGLPMLVVGIVELLAISGGIPASYKILLNELFSGYSSGRIQLVMSEASWAAKVSIFWTPIYIFMFRVSRNRFYGVCAAICFALFLSTFSLYGYAIAVTAAGLFGLLKVRSFTGLWAVSVRLALAAGIVVGSAMLVWQAYEGEGGYMVNRVRRVLESQDPLALLSYDGSTYLRVANPAIGIVMMLEKPWGVGLGGYALHYEDYLARFPIQPSLRFVELHEDLATKSADPKSLYAKVASETGVVGVLLGGAVLLISMTRMRRLALRCANDRRVNLSAALLAIAASTALQTASFLYLPYWVALVAVVAAQNELGREEAWPKDGPLGMPLMGSGAIGAKESESISSMRTRAEQVE